MNRLVEIMRILRSPDGCPWDREQTLDSLRPYIVEETYEVLEAIETLDTSALRDELGDLLLEVVFAAQICAEDGYFTITDALTAVCDKLVRRHPHVFDAETDAQTGNPVQSTADVRLRWEAIKAHERKAIGKTASALGSLPTALPPCSEPTGWADAPQRLASTGITRPKLSPRCMRSSPNSKQRFETEKQMQ